MMYYIKVLKLLCLLLVISFSTTSLVAQEIPLGRFLKCKYSKNKKEYFAIGINKKSAKIKVIYRDSETEYLPTSACRKLADSEALVSKAKIKVPFVKQSRGKLCGPASIEMIFRYWGISSFSQYDIMKSILRLNKNVGRYKKLKLNNINTFDAEKYPGTGTIIMRTFLKRFASVENARIKRLPKNKREAALVFEAFLNRIQFYVSKKIPVIVHQNWSLRSTAGHYRVVTGFDKTKKLVYLNDARTGEIIQNYDLFLNLSNVRERWLPFNFVILKPKNNKLVIKKLL